MPKMLSIDGRLTVRHQPEALILLETLDTGAIAIECVRIQASTVRLAVGGCFEACGDDYVHVMAELRKLVPYLTAPAMLRMEYDGFVSSVYLGPPEEEATTRSQTLMRKIMRRSSTLLPEHRQQLGKWLLGLAERPRDNERI